MRFGGKDHRDTREGAELPPKPEGSPVKGTIDLEDWK